MKLYIRIKDGVPFEHPIIEDNLKEALPDIDLTNLPNDLVEFVRVAPPELKVYETFEDPAYTYQLVDGKCTDVWHIRSMTPTEKINKQNQVKQRWADENGWSSWVFDEELCYMKAPIDPPAVSGKQYLWRESDTSWVEVPPYPTDGGDYMFDVETASWTPRQK